MRVTLDSITYLDLDGNARKVVLLYDGTYIPGVGPYILERYVMPKYEGSEIKTWELAAESHLGRFEEARQSWRKVCDIVFKQRDGAYRNKAQHIQQVNQLALLPKDGGV